uniref:t-SNARE coiled-coil homology domain-containing protein n=1 Tax=Lotharella globosa TaxID=91324 RepID=A0A6U2X661_9EUKA|mmetsp:Transcript_21897/g.43989  ORF Transcript_21897/g.43989 Transcript_21897/m.43989 type:complete len:107 (+) Transcript_21897:145-465(+)
MAQARHRYGRGAAMETMEEQNNNLIGNLHEKVIDMKKIALAIGGELKDQNEHLDKMDSGMGNLKQIFSKTMSAMSSLTQGGGSCHMCYLVCFVFVFFLLVKWLIMG